jgi:hypothetical protein
MLYLGIDPGAGGGIACIDNGVTFAEAMPATGPDIFALLRDQMVKPGRTVAVIEDVHTMPGQNIAAAGAFLKHADEVAEGARLPDAAGEAAHAHDASRAIKGEA